MKSIIVILLLVLGMLLGGCQSSRKTEKAEDLQLACRLIQAEGVKFWVCNAEGGYNPRVVVPCTECKVPPAWLPR